MLINFLLCVLNVCSLQLSPGQKGQPGEPVPSGPPGPPARAAEGGPQGPEVYPGQPGVPGEDEEDSQPVSLVWYSQVFIAFVVKTFACFLLLL